MKLHPISFLLSVMVICALGMGESPQSNTVSAPKTTKEGVQSPPGRAEVPKTLQSSPPQATNAPSATQTLEQARAAAYLEGVRIGVYFGRRNPDMSIQDVQRYAAQLWQQQMVAEKQP